MSDFEIITNYHKRELFYGWELTKEESKEFDWLNDSDLHTLEDSQFFRYKGQVYCILDFMSLSGPFGDRNPFGDYWSAYSNDTFFSGILIRFEFDEDGRGEESVIVGTFFS